MSKSLLVYVMAILFLLSAVSSAQNLLNGPESVAFDTINNRCLVSNVYGGAIISIDENGDHSYFKTGLGSCLGNVVHYVLRNVLPVDLGYYRIRFQLGVAARGV